jgi:type I restriction enzyme S subunit
MAKQNTSNSSTPDFITEHLDIWTSAIKTKSAAGRGSSKKLELVGVKKLRELILELAVKGKLVPQDPYDEPASELLKKIEAEKSRLVKEGKIKKQKPLPSIAAEEKPFELPKKWMWTRLGYATNYGSCDKIEAKDTSPETWVLELEDVEKQTSKLLQKRRFNEREFKSSKNVFVRGDVIYGKLRPYLDKVLVADESGVCTTEMIPVRAFKELLPEFLRLSMKSPNFKEYANNSTHGMNLPRMGTDKAKLALIPLCTIQEQHRIVAKVDELMVLCDQLEAETEASIDAHKTLVEVLLATLTDAKDASELNDNWQTISQHFDVLFTTQDAISQLKQTILQLAVMGKLVKQDPRILKPQPSEIYQKVKDERQSASFSKTTGKYERAIFDFSKHKISVPENWTMEPLADLALTIVDCPHSTPKWSETGEVCVRTSQFKPGFLDLASTRYVSSATYKERVERLVPQEGDILYSREGGILGVACIIPQGVKLCLGQRMMLIRCPTFIKPQFLEIILNSPFINVIAEENTTGGAAPRVNLTTVKAYPIPTPPIEEQLRIVSKVDDLMTLCDSLKERLNQAQTTQLHLTDAIVEQAL